VFRSKQLPAALMLVTGLFDIYALLFGIFGGIIAELVNDQPLGPFLEHAVRERLDHRPVGLGAEDDALRRDHRDRVLLQGHGCLQVDPRASAGRSTRPWSSQFTAIASFDYVFTQTLLATHPQILVIK
jgi:phospholipid/cholesterol/gamma-HCH transport system permease protein